MSDELEGKEPQTVQPPAESQAEPASEPTAQPVSEPAPESAPATPSNLLASLGAWALLMLATRAGAPTEEPKADAVDGAATHEATGGENVLEHGRRKSGVAASAATELSAPTGAQPDSSSSKPEKTGAEAWAGLIVLLVWGAIAFVIAWNIPRGREFIDTHKITLGIVTTLLVILVAIVGGFRKGGSTAKAGIGVFGLVPLIFLALATLFLVPPTYQVAIVRCVLLILLCLLPGSMYFLFIATKKFSLVDEYLNHVKRLGLVDDTEDDNCPPHEERRDIQFYINKFEAVLGRVPPGFVQKLRAVKSRDTDSPSASDAQESAGLTELFSKETLLPVVLTTFLIALCWIVTLPPWQGRLILALPEATPAEDRGQQQTSVARSPGQPQLRNLSYSSLEEIYVLRIQQQKGAQDDAGQQKPADPGTESKKVDNWLESWLRVIAPVPIPEFYAFMGAYFFSVQMLFRRYTRRDLRPSAYVSVSVRIAIAIIGTWGAIQAWKIFVPKTNTESAGMLVMGFIIGVFPRVAWQVIAVAGTKIFGDWLKIPSFQTQLPINQLDGLTSWHEARLEEEDIENVPNMATADIVDLILNTRIPTDRIVDWMDQAILYTHIGPEAENEGADTRRKRLRGHGIYTASALVTRYQQSDEDGTRADLERILGDGKPSPVVSLVDAVQTNPNLKPIMKWRGLC